MVVLFSSSRPLGRCENLTAIWDAYDGDKEFAQLGYGDCSRFDAQVVVTDEFVQRKRDGQTVVMVGHGLAGGKLYGCDQPHGVYTPEKCGLVDWFVTSSEHGVPISASAAGIPQERCLPLGMPRTDAYFGKSKGDGGTFLAKFDRAYLFAPTFRASWEPRAPEIDWKALDGELDDDEVLVVKRHMVNGNQLAGGTYAHVVEVDPSEPSTPYLVDCDVVVTDYSSIVLDGYVLGKPSVLMCEPDDLEAYTAARGFYWSFPRDYGRIACESPRYLVDYARIAVHDGMTVREHECRKRTASACDGHSTERVVEFVRSLT